MITIDEKLCQACHTCMEACPNYILTKGPTVDRAAAAFCIACGHCAAACPEGAIAVMGYQGLALEPLPSRPQIEPQAMMTLLRGRRSIRTFKRRTVAKKHLKALLLAASVAPSAGNQHVVKAYVYKDPMVITEVREKIVAYYAKLLRLLRLPGVKTASTLFGSLPPEKVDFYHQALRVITDPKQTRDRLFRRAPVIMVFTTPVNNDPAVVDAFLAAQNATLFAETVGIGTCYNGFLVQAAGKDSGVRTALRIPKKETVVVSMTLGYPKIRYSRTAPRKKMETVWI